MKDNIDKLKMLNDIDDKFIEEASETDKTAETKSTEVSEAKAAKKVVNFKKWGSIAAAVVILAVSVTALTFGLKAGKGSKDKKSDSLVMDTNNTDEVSETSTESAASEKSSSSAESKKDAAASVAADEASSESVSYIDIGEKGLSPEKNYSHVNGDVISDDVPAPEGTDRFPEKKPDENSAEALLLTAGQWNDNANWGFFMNLVNTGKIAFPAYGLDPINRIVITLQDEDGNPLEGYNVSACSLTDGKYLDSWLYETVSDKNGKAYLFLRNDSNLEEIGISVRAEYKPFVEEVVKLQKTEDSQGNGKNKYAPIEKTITVKGENRRGNETQVMFILDTTGSMGDELAYLQKDFSKIVEDVNIDNISYSVNFYKDEGDEYVVKSNPFTSDAKEIQTLLNAESAGGGGDLPEAVAQALSDCMQNTGWNTMSGKKIAFLIFDAPPHDGEEEGLYTAVKAAAKRGIHVIPVVASNADRKTELFGRALAIMTNGEYVFLTDDSGIGGSHLEPIIGNYEVEKLHDIIVRIIESY